jgi:hypothetical protein
MDWTDMLLDQLTYDWDDKARPRLVGLTDDEYLWEPVAGTCTPIGRSAGRTERAAGTAAAAHEATSARSGWKGASRRTSTDVKPAVPRSARSSSTV